eukprot:723908-Rhodomonas_salina.1
MSSLLGTPSASVSTSLPLVWSHSPVAGIGPRLSSSLGGGPVPVLSAGIEGSRGGRRSGRAGVERERESVRPESVRREPGA